MKLSPFHLAIPVNNLDECRIFYRDTLCCTEGRSSDHWVDFNFYGHQLVIHEIVSATSEEENSNPVDGHDVPVPHFGVVLDWTEWEKLADRLKKLPIEFIIDPYIRFKGQVGEQATMFFKDPSRNALEFKSFRNMDMLFEK